MHQLGKKAQTLGCGLISSLEYLHFAPGNFNVLMFTEILDK